MSCVLYGPDSRKRTAALLLDLEQIDRVIDSLGQHSLDSTVLVDLNEYTLKLTIGEVRDVFIVRGAKIEHELSILGIKLSEAPQPTTEKETLPSIERARSELGVTESVTEVRHAQEA